MLKFLCKSAENFTELSKDELLEKEFKIGEKLGQKYIYDKFPEASDKQKDLIKDTLRKKLKTEKIDN